MTLMPTSISPGRVVPWWGAALCVVFLLNAAGCSNGTTSSGAGTGTDGNDEVTDGGEFVAEIVNISSIRQVSLLQSFESVLYTVTGAGENATIGAFYVPVEDESGTVAPDATPVPIVGEAALVTGTNQAFRFIPADAGMGSFKVGITVVRDTGVNEALSEGIIQVLGPPDPRFIQPTDPVTTIARGDPVAIRFDVGDPEEDARWRLFFIDATDPLDPLPNLSGMAGTELDTDAGNYGSYDWPTSTLNPGRYEIGLSTTDSGETVANTIADHNDHLVITIPNENTAEVERRVIEIIEPTEPVPPTVAFSAPGTSEVMLFRDQAYSLQFGVVAGAGAVVDLFYDDDEDQSSFTNIPGATNLPASQTSYPFPTDLPEGVYRVGATVREGTFASVTVYATGAIRVVRTPTLTVTEPTKPVTIKPLGSSEGTDSVTVTWTTNVPPIAATVDVFARAVDASNNPSGPEIEVMAASSTAVTTTEFQSADTGTYQITVRLTFNDPSLDRMTGTAREFVRVSSASVVLWLGSLAEADPIFEGAVFEGVNFEDNAGSSLSRVSDLDGDGTDEFIIGARYGKPFFTNPSGIGSGEAYLIYGSTTGYTGVFNLNSVGTGLLPGVTFTGVRAPQRWSDLTVGLTSISRLPDMDGDGRDELVFGFPDVVSRGHNASPLQDGVINPRAIDTLEREYQFVRGGIVIVSSRNSSFTGPNAGTSVINLDLVGQDFESLCVEPEPDALLPDDYGEFFTNAHADMNWDTLEGCDGDCDDPSSGGKEDATEYIDYGFVAALARDYFSTYVYSFEFYGGVSRCVSPDEFQNHECLGNRLDRDLAPVPHEYCAPYTASCNPYSPGLHAYAVDPDGFFDEMGFRTTTRHSGYYVYYEEVGGSPRLNQALEPFGARVIGVGISDEFGTSLALSNATGVGAGDIIVSAANRTARGILLGPQGGPEEGGEIQGLESTPGTAKVNQNSGVAYIFPLRSLWTDEDLFAPPRPHQYIVGEASHCGGPFPLADGDNVLIRGVIDNISATRVAGLTNDRIANIAGIDDFNADGFNDFAIGSPTANNDQGRVYVAFRRNPALEGDYVLEKLALDPDDPERLIGVLIVTETVDSLGASLVTGVDFNGDGSSDLVIGSPDAAEGRGEIIVVFGDPNLTSPVGGITVESLLTTRNAQGLPRAARITGNALDPNGQFGFNVANAGDVDGDGLADLLIAAPGATPRFDPDPNDSDDALTEAGVDTDLDGVKDDVSGANGLPDGVVDTLDDLEAAGLVYLVFGKNRLDELPSSDISISIDQIGTGLLDGFMVAGRRAGDRIGGGDAGEPDRGGTSSKRNRGRSNGLASAGDVDGDGHADLLIGSVLADPRRDPGTGRGVHNGGEAYLVYGSAAP